MSKPDRKKPATPIEIQDRWYEVEVAYIEAGGGQNGADFSGFAELLSPRVVMHQAPSLPYGGEWVGHDGIERFFRVFADCWESLTISDVRHLQTDNELIISLRSVATARATGKIVDAPMIQAVKIADGLIVDVKPFYWDTAAVAAACHKIS
jgi:ketosteroid isomerase-like protein